MSATSFEDARNRKRLAQAALDDRNVQKRNAALKDPQAVDAEYAAKASGRRWSGPNAFDRNRGVS